MPILINGNNSTHLSLHPPLNSFNLTPHSFNIPIQSFVLLTVWDSRTARG
jgi:hypothetical protein